MNEMLLTVEQVAERLQLRPITIREQLKRGRLRGIKRGHQWRIPESALTESTITEVASVELVQTSENWTIAAEKLSLFYAASLSQNDEFTAISTAPAEFENEV